MSIKFAARSSAKSKAKRLTKVTTGKVDASGWRQPHESATPRVRRAYKDGGKVEKIASNVGEIEKEAGCKKGRADKRPRKMDGGPMTGPNDPRQVANTMMQKAASQAPVSGSNPIPTFTSPLAGKSPLRHGFKKGGEVGKAPALTKTKVGTNYPDVPKRIPISGEGAIKPNTDFGPEGAGKLKKGGRVGKLGGGALIGGILPDLASGDGGGKKATLTPALPGAKKGGRVCKADGGAMDGDDKDDRCERKAGGRVKGKTNINIIIAPGGGDKPAAPPQMGAPGAMPHPMMPPVPPPGAPPGGASGAGAPGAGPSPLAGIPPQLLAQAMGGGGAGASMPPSGPPHLPMRAAGGRIMRAGAGSGLGRLEKQDEMKDGKAEKKPLQRGV